MFPQNSIYCLLSSDVYLAEEKGWEFEVTERTILIVESWHPGKLDELIELASEHGLWFVGCTSLVRPKKKNGDVFNYLDGEWEDRKNLVCFVGKNMSKPRRRSVVECFKLVGCSIGNQSIVENVLVGVDVGFGVTPI